jgi:hypothetical protein
MGACDKKGEGSKSMAMRIRVAGDEEGKGDKEGDGISNKGGVRRRAQLLWRQGDEGGPPCLRDVGL